MSITIAAASTEHATDVRSPLGTKALGPAFACDDAPVLDLAPLGVLDGEGRGWDLVARPRHVPLQCWCVRRRLRASLMNLAPRPDPITTSGVPTKNTADEAFGKLEAIARSVASVAMTIST